MRVMWMAFVTSLTTSVLGMPIDRRTVSLPQPITPSGKTSPTRPEGPAMPGDGLNPDVLTQPNGKVKVDPNKTPDGDLEKADPSNAPEQGEQEKTDDEKSQDIYDGCMSGFINRRSEGRSRFPDIPPYLKPENDIQAAHESGQEDFCYEEALHLTGIPPVRNLPPQEKRLKPGAAVPRYNDVSPETADEKWGQSIDVPDLGAKVGVAGAAAMSLWNGATGAISGWMPDWAQ